MSDSPNAWAVPGKNGGMVMINTGCLQACETIDEVAGVLSHELGHVVARHVAERRTSRWFAIYVAGAFGFKGDLGDDLVLSRIQEAEADHMGLIYMAQAGFDPQKQVDLVARRFQAELATLRGSRPKPEFLSTHPSVSSSFSPESVADIDSALQQNCTDGV